uniref:Family with sequence similarity 210 member B n=1 Tax=Otus sunia TaxID=257818 RepID=A0A8C8BGK5_9STRI
ASSAASCLAPDQKAVARIHCVKLSSGCKQRPLWAPQSRLSGSCVGDAGGSPEKAATDPSGENKKLHKSQQLKQVFKEYGAIGVSFHVGISLVSLGIFYLAVSSGVDMTAVLFKLGFSESSLQSKMAAGTSTFVLAYAVHKLFAPVRISITIVSVPFIVRYCRKIGFFKPPASNP